VALKNSINLSLQDYEDKHGKKLNVDFEVCVQQPTDEPCLQVVDYINRAIQRAYTKEEPRFLEFIKEKVHLIWDIYDKANFPHNFYTQHKNPFDLQKISPIRATAELNPSTV
jgi:hypothetical protein